MQVNVDVKWYPDAQAVSHFPAPCVLHPLVGSQLASQLAVIPYNKHIYVEKHLHKHT